MKSNIPKIKNILYTCVVATIIVGINLPITQAQNQDPLPAEVVNAIAQKTTQKFNSSSCQDLAASMEKHGQSNGQPLTLKDQLNARFIERLRQDPLLTQEFFGQIYTPVLTKLFECGLVPPQE